MVLLVYITNPCIDIIKKPLYKNQICVKLDYIHSCLDTSMLTMSI